MRRDLSIYKQKIDRYKHIYLYLSPKNHRNPEESFINKKSKNTKMKQEYCLNEQVRAEKHNEINHIQKIKSTTEKTILRIGTSHRYSQQKIMEILSNADYMNELNKLLDRFNSFSTNKNTKIQKLVRFKF